MDRPYPEFIGVAVHHDGILGVPVCTLPPGDKVSGDPGFFHGGAIAALLEAAAGVMVESVIADADMRIQPMSITVDYLRPAQLFETQAKAEIVRRGERIAHVDAIAWQEDVDKPIAMARLIFSLRS